MNQFSLYEPESGNYHYYIGGQPNVMIPENRGTFMPVQNILVSLPEGGHPVGIGKQAKGILLSPGGIQPSIPVADDDDWNDHLFVKLAFFVGGIIFWNGLRG